MLSGGATCLMLLEVRLPRCYWEVRLLIVVNEVQQPHLQLFFVLWRCDCLFYSVIFCVWRCDCLMYLSSAMRGATLPLAGLSC